MQLLVIGLGADGESSFDQLHQLLHRSRKAHALLGYRSFTEIHSGIVFKAVPTPALAKLKPANKSRRGKQTSSAASTLSTVISVCALEPAVAEVVSTGETTDLLDFGASDEKTSTLHDAYEVGLIVNNLRSVRTYGIKDVSACPNIIVDAIDNKSEEYRVIPRHMRYSLPRSWAAGLVVFDAQWVLSQSDRPK